MAPVPDSAAPTAKPSTDSHSPLPAIIGIVIFSLFIVGAVCTIILYILHRRKQIKKLPPSHRPTSYRPFRTSSSKDGQSLLANAAPTSETDDKSSMFSRARSDSSIPLYVPEETEYRRVSVDRQSLIPLHITPPAPDDNGNADPMNKAGAGSSVGSGVSGRSRGTSVGSMSSLYPASSTRESVDLGVARPNRPRRLSARYYEAVTVTEPLAAAPKGASR